MAKNLNCLISAGPTREWIDPVRFISNPSSGKMGYALAKEAKKRGFVVNLVTGPVSIKAVDGITVKQVETAEEMRIAMIENYDTADLVLMCAAVSDHRPKFKWHQKKKKIEFPKNIEMIPNEDILEQLGRKKKKFQTLVGFAAETENGAQNALMKLKKKNLDWIALNDVSNSSIGFNSDFNEITLFSSGGKIAKLAFSSKEELATQMFELILK
ncbi:MAG: phosphopantothenoylcysteine decarboxylase [Opitutae bacterium]|jgi:phosphopantothenoylcysteine decarboxylase / phosphopantothenate---cysteine ligase|nr:phosphopantothenoylcysteine decarboxylase [Opitutae bacterium]MBT5716245.1 phosphopantothenoylcysteine decarboxylase [Opitutae bacterium]